MRPALVGQRCTVLNSLDLEIPRPGGGVRTAADLNEPLVLGKDTLAGAVPAPTAPPG